MAAFSLYDMKGRNRRQQQRDREESERARECERASSLEASCRASDVNISNLQGQLESRDRQLASVRMDLESAQEKLNQHQQMNQELAHNIVDRSDALLQAHAQELEKERGQHRRALDEKDELLSGKDAEIARLRGALERTKAELESARSPASSSALWASSYSTTRGPPARMAMVWSLLANVRSALAAAKTPARTVREAILDFKKAAQREREDTGAAATEEDAVVETLELREMPLLVSAMQAAAEKAPLVDKATGWFSEYDFTADVERKQGSAPSAWRLLRAMILAPWQRRCMARMRRSLESPFEETFRFGSKLLTKAEVKGRLSRTLDQINLHAAAVLDHVVYVRQRGSQVISPLLQRLVVAARAGNGITLKNCRFFSRIGLLPGPDAADAALTAVAAAYLENFGGTYAALFPPLVAADVCVVLAILVDNFVTKAGQFATLLKAEDNALTTATLQGLVWPPPPRVVGDLKKPSQRATVVCPPFSADRLTAFFDGGKDKLLPSKQGSPLPPLFDPANTWLAVAIPPSHLEKVSQRDYTVVPSADARSSSFTDYEKHVIDKHEELAAGALVDGHRVLCHDTEFILHFFRLLHKCIQSTRLQNYLIMPNEFHNEKHAGEAILQVPEHILFFYSKLWINVLKYAATKWSATRAAVQAEAESSAEGVEQLRAALVGGGDAAAAAVAEAQEAADSVAEAAAAVAAEADEVEAAGGGAEPTVRGVQEALEAAAGGGGGDGDDDDDDDDDDGGGGEEENGGGEEAPEKMNLTSVAMLKKLGRPALREQVRAHCGKLHSDVKDMLKAACISELERELELPKKEPKKAKSSAQSAMVNATRLLNSNNQIIQRWCGAKMMAGGGGGDVRGKVLARARQVAVEKGWVVVGATEGEVLEAIFNRSEVFKGLWSLIDVEISAVVLSMAHWAQGNLEPYLRLFPVLCQIVAADKETKPNIVKVMHLSQERLVLYNNDHADVLQFYGRACLGLRETAIETHHARLTLIIDKHTHDLEHKHYVRGTCLLSPVDKLKASLMGALGEDSKEKDMERLKNIKRTLGKTHDDTNSKLDEFLFTGVGFGPMLDQLEIDGECSGEYADGKWSEKSRNRLSQGQKNFEDALPATVAWLKKQEVQEAKDPAEETLVEWLTKTGTTIKKVLLPELRRRGLQVSGNKSDLATRINDHAKENPTGHKNADEKDEGGYGKDCAARPDGFLGVMPVPAP